MSDLLFLDVWLPGTTVTVVLLVAERIRIMAVALPIHHGDSSAAPPSLVGGATETESFASSPRDEFAFFEGQEQYEPALVDCQND
jgi:hypothetical protein